VEFYRWKKNLQRLLRHHADRRACAGGRHGAEEKKALDLLTPKRETGVRAWKGPGRAQRVGKGSQKLRKKKRPSAKEAPTRLKSKGRSELLPEQQVPENHPPYTLFGEGAVSTPRGSRFRTEGIGRKGVPAARLAQETRPKGDQPFQLQKEKIREEPSGAIMGRDLLLLQEREPFSRRRVSRRNEIILNRTIIDFLCAKEIQAARLAVEGGRAGKNRTFNYRW